MKQIIALCFLILTLTTGLYGTSIKSDVDEVLEGDLYEDVDVSISLYSLTDERIVYQRYAYVPHTPASLVKLFITAAMLEEEGPDFRFQTPVYLNKKEPFNLYIKGVGDPSLKISQLDLIVDELKKREIQEIYSIFLDESYIKADRNLYANNARYYYAPAAAFNINYNQINVTITNNRYVWEPDTPYARINARFAQVATSNSVEPTIKMEVFQRKGHDAYHLSGIATQENSDRGSLNLRITRPAMFFSSVIQDKLYDNDISLIHSIEGNTFSRKGKKKILTIESEPLVELLRTMNHDSNNMMANCFLKGLGAGEYGSPGTFNTGTKRLQTILEKRVGLDSKNWKMYDGSGLSRSNTLTAAHVRQLLAYMHHKKRFDLYKTLLVNPKEDSQYNDLNIPEHLDLYFKTGTLSSSGVNNIAGFIIDKERQKTYSFVILAQNPETRKKYYKGTLTTPILNTLLKKL